MAQMLEFDVVAVLEKLDAKMDKMAVNLDKMAAENASFKGQLQVLESKVERGFATVDARLDGFSKRLENQELVNRGVVVSLFVAAMGIIVGGVAKLFGAL